MLIKCLQTDLRFTPYKFKWASREKIITTKLYLWKFPPPNDSQPASQPAKAKATTRGERQAIAEAEAEKAGISSINITIITGRSRSTGTGTVATTTAIPSAPPNNHKLYRTTATIQAGNDSSFVCISARKRLWAVWRTDWLAGCLPACLAIAAHRHSVTWCLHKFCI